MREEVPSASHGERSHQNATVGHFDLVLPVSELWENTFLLFNSLSPTPVWGHLL